MDAKIDRAPSSQLIMLFRAIAEDDGARVARLLSQFPDLAVDPTPAGASRATAGSFFLERISHHVYAGDTALHVAAAAQKAKLARELLERGAAVQAKNRRGAEPLHYACDRGAGSSRWSPEAQAATIECLLASGADPNAADRSGVTPLHRAVRARSAAAVAVLLEHGADARRRNGRGSTPLHLAVQTTGRSGSGSAAAHEQQPEIVRLLIANGARLTDRNASGRTVAAIQDRSRSHNR